MPGKYDFEVASVTDKGKKKVNNEDAILINTGENQWGTFGLFIIADGVGGLDRGKEASEQAVLEVNAWWDHKLPVLLSQKKSIDCIAKDLKVEAELINLKIFEESGKKEGLMATTFSVLILVNDQGRIIHIGDSRIYQIRKNELELLTEDHTWVSQQIRKGLLKEEEAIFHKNKHAITRCLGYREWCEFFQNQVSLKKDDLYILCSDGFYNYYTDSELVHFFEQRKKTEQSYQELLQSMVERIYQLGAHDNISIILVKINKHDGCKRWWNR